MESLAGDIADRNEAELENAEDPKFANPSKGESAQSGESSKFVAHQNVDSMDGEEGKAWEIICEKIIRHAYSCIRSHSAGVSLAMMYIDPLLLSDFG